MDNELYKYNLNDRYHDLGYIWLHIARIAYILDIDLTKKLRNIYTV